MDKTTLQETLAALQAENPVYGSNSFFTTAGLSMLFMITPGDIITVQKVAPRDIRLGDIISVTEKRAGVPPYSHRVIWKKQGATGFSFLTKGDYCLLPDKQWATVDMIIGKLVAVTKTPIGLQINLLAGPGKYLSFASFFVSLPFTPVSWILNLAHHAILRCIKLCVLSWNILHSPRELFSLDVLETTPQWETIKKEHLRLFETLALPKHPAIGDAGFGNGYSEQALHCIRAGTAVTLIGLHTQCVPSLASTFDCIFVSRLPASSRSFLAQKQLFRTLYSYLKPGGSLLISLPYFNAESISRQLQLPEEKAFFRLLASLNGIGAHTKDMAAFFNSLGFNCKEALALETADVFLCAALK